MQPQGKLTFCSGCSLCLAIHMQPSVSGAWKLDLSNMGRQALVSHKSSSWCGMTLDIWRSLLHILFVAITTTTTTTVLQPFFQDHPGEPAPEKNFWTLWCKGILTEADTLTIQMGATPSGLTSAHLHRPPHMALKKPGKLGAFFSYFVATLLQLNANNWLLGIVLRFVTFEYLCALGSCMSVTANQYFTA